MEELQKYKKQKEQKRPDVKVVESAVRAKLNDEMHRRLDQGG